MKESTLGIQLRSAFVILLPIIGLILAIIDFAPVLAQITTSHTYLPLIVNEADDSEANSIDRWKLYNHRETEWSARYPENWSYEEFEWLNHNPRKFDYLVRFHTMQGETVSVLIWDEIGNLPLDVWTEKTLSPLIPEKEPEYTRVESLGMPTLWYIAKGDLQHPASLFIHFVYKQRGYRLHYIAANGGRSLQQLKQFIASIQLGDTLMSASKDRNAHLIPSNLQELDYSNYIQYHSRSYIKVSESNCGEDNEFWDPTYNRYDCGQCTWWAAYSRPDIPMNYDEWAAHADGGYWDDRAREHPNFDVVDTPSTGALAVWEPTHNNPSGHVAYVTSVHIDGTFDVTEMNYGDCEGTRGMCTRTNLSSNNVSFIPAGVTIFQNQNFGGEWERYTENISSIQLEGGVSSIYIPPQWDMIAFNAPNYQSAWRERYGTASLESSLWDLTQDNFSDSSNMNDRISSMKVTYQSCILPPGLNAAGIAGCQDVPPTRPAPPTPTNTPISPVTSTFTPQSTFTPTNTPRPPTPTVTPIPQSCTNPPPDRNVAYLFENENCVNPWNWSSGHPSDGANHTAKSAWMPSGKVLLLSERNDGGEPRICLSSPVRNLADIGWGNRVEWAEMHDGCPVVQPTATPSGPKHEAKFYEEPNFVNQVFTLNSPGTYRYSDLGYVDQFRKFYSVDLCSGCSIQLTNKRGDSICWGWDENNIGDHGDWPLVTVQIKFSYQNECPPREPSLQSPEEGAQFWEGDSVYVVWKDNDDPTSMYFTTEVRYGGTTIAQKYRTTERSLTVTKLAPGNYTIQSQSCSDLMCSSWKTRAFSVRVNPTATPTWTPTATDTATPRPTTTPTFTATPSPQPITTSTATATFPTRSAIPSVISPQSELVVGVGEAVTFRWQPLSYPVEYLIYVNRNGVRVTDSGGLRSNTWTYTFAEPGTYDWTISSLCLGCIEYFSGFSQTYIVYAGGAPPATPTDTLAPSPTSTATPTPEPECLISIEQGALFTGQPTVRIHAAVPNAAEAQLSNDGGFAGALWQPYASELTWTLSDPGQKIVTLLVYARFRDAASRPLCSNTALPDDIIYDPLPPTVRIESFTPIAYTNAANLSVGTPGLLTVVAEDQAGGSGVTAMRVGYQADLSTLPWVPFTAVTQVNDLTGKTIFVEVRDAVGNRSTTASWSVDPGSSLYLPLIKR